MTFFFDSTWHYLRIHTIRTKTWNSEIPEYSVTGIVNNMALILGVSKEHLGHMSGYSVPLEIGHGRMQGKND
jgi:hypothetical protein